ncbi:hypothetical protein V6N11_017485 [Hibiscus sabdariffa]|uniref:Uncharacterized protein n=1 Tax=Hibiscus sabdariffa TaxID=183260 RepID=A0ABR2TYI2_9ROSI
MGMVGGSKSGPFSCGIYRMDCIRRVCGSVLIAMAKDTHDSFWRRKRGSVPRLPDPLQGDVVVDAGIMRADRVVRPCQSVEGIVDDEKLSVLQTCAIGWLKEATSIKVLA